MSTFMKHLLVLLISVLIVGCASNNRIPRPADTSPRSNSFADSSNKDLIFEPEDSGSSAYPPALIEDGSGSLDGDALTQRDESEDGDADGSNAIASIYFDFDKAAVSKPEERAKLKSIAAQMKADASMKVLAEGHCDWRGTVEYNMALGERRAKAVLRYLKTLEIPESRIKTVSKGDLNAVIEGTSTQMGKDRRVDIIPLR